MSPQSLIAIQLVLDALGLLALVLILIKFFKEPKRGPIPCTTEVAETGCALVASAGPDYSAVDEWQANDTAAVLARGRLFSHRSERQT